VIEWNVSPEIVSIGPLTIRWYGVLFATAFILGYQIMIWIYKKEKKDLNDLNDLIWYMVLGTVIGARLGHCLFYNPSFYLSNPLEIVMVWKGGLASHGAALGIIIALSLYSIRKKESFVYLADRIVITVALAAFFVRMGNLFNSEIIGIPSDVPWSFVFTSVDNIPRHPSQLYEAIAYLIFFIILFNLYRIKYPNLKKGFLLGLFLILLFTFRFFVEFVKEEQSGWEEGMILKMGQLLSIPLILFGVIMLIKAQRQKLKSNST